MNYRPKLIEVALPLTAINEGGYREQTIKRGKPTQMHKWWAGRPLTTARAVIWASLVDDPSSDLSLTDAEVDRERMRLFAILSELCDWSQSNNETVISAARAEIMRCYPDGAPKFIDPFGGGGALPLEAQRLGLETHSGDLNPVAVMLQKGMMEIPPRFAGLEPVAEAAKNRRHVWFGNEGLAEDVEAFGRWMQDQAESRIGHLYSEPEVQLVDGRMPIAWIWARTIQSPDPSWGGYVPLVTTWWLAKKKGAASVWVEPAIDFGSQTVEYFIRHGGAPTVEPTIARATGRCIATGAAISNEYIVQEAKAGRLRSQLIAIVAKQRGQAGRIFLPPTRVASGVLGSIEAPAEGPRGNLPDGGLGFRVQKYGFTEWAQLFNPRQLHAAITMSDLLDEVEARVTKVALASGRAEDSTPLAEGGTGAKAYAEAIRLYLAFVVNRVAVWNNSLCAWDSTNVVNQQLFSRQTVPMIWDHCEIRPFDSAAGSFANSLSTVTDAIRALPRSVASAKVEQMDARRHLEVAGASVVSTDPPYYDNIGYADLSDFFYVWMRRNLIKSWPDYFATLLSPKGEELIADPSRHGGRIGGKQFFESGMTQVMKQLRESLDASTPATIYYAYKATESNGENSESTGWSTFLQALIDADLAVTATWPLRTENPSRMRAIGSNAMTVSILLVCRPREVSAELATRSQFVQALRSELPTAVSLLQRGNIAPVDLPQSTIGPGIRIFSSYAKVVESDGARMSVATALELINDVLSEVLDGEESEMDADSRFAFAWYSQFGFEAGLSGDADSVARAKNTSATGVVDAGIGEAQSGKFRLLRRSELAPDWSPLTDSRPTVWEATQYLIAALDRSESEAAELLRQLDGYGERARVLAYLLFKKATDRGWAEEAGAYNGLIMAWPALQVASAPTTQQSMELG